MSTLLNRSTLAPAVANLGLLTIMAASAMPLFHVDMSITRVIFAIGALLVLVGRLFRPVPAGALLRLKRLYRMDVVCGVFFVVAAVLIFVQGPLSSNWLAFTMAGAVLQIYTSFMISRHSARESK